jgi:hypothetical protein
MKKRGLQPESVTLPHNTEGHWIGNKNAKNVIVYYHGAFQPRVTWRNPSTGTCRAKT